MDRARQITTGNYVRVPHSYATVTARMGGMKNSPRPGTPVMERRKPRHGWDMKYAQLPGKWMPVQLNSLKPLPVTATASHPDLETNPPKAVETRDCASFQITPPQHLKSTRKRGMGRPGQWPHAIPLKQ
jgi:hypothetical protein